MTLKQKVADAVVDHIRRHRMTVIAAVQRLPELRGYKGSTVRRLLGSLCKSGAVGRASLYRGEEYFYLGQLPQGPTTVQARTGPLSEPAKIRNYALLHHCCLGTVKRRRLTANDLQSHLPELHRPGVPLNYYINVDASLPRLGFVRVDVGGRGRWDRVLAKCQEDLRLHWSHTGCREFIRRDLFEVTVITALPQKAARLQRTLTELDDPRTNLIRVSACPELINLIAPPPS